MEFSSGKIISITPKTPDSFHIELDVDSKLFSTHKTPGQYIVVRLPELPELKDGYFALSNKPGTPWTLLIKKSSPLTEKILSLSKSDELLLSSAQGRGFIHDAKVYPHVIALAIGSGIAPIYALLQSFVEKPPQSTELFYGVRTIQDFAYKKEIDSLSLKNFKIHYTLSQPEPSWEGYKGYIWQYLDSLKAGNSTAIYVCGHKKMIDDSTQKLLGLGFKKEQIFLNY